MRLQGAENCRKSLWDGLRRLSRTILDYIICIYLVLMLAVFPFYNEAGYDHIGTDKSTFFCRLGVSTGKILVIPLVLCLIAESVIFIRQHFAGKKASERTFTGQTSVRQKFAGPGLTRRKVILQKQDISISPTDIFALVYCAALFLSYVCTDYREEALWGERGWYMGLLPQLILICIYFLVSRFWTPRKWIFYIVLPASGAVFVMGCMNRFGIYSFGLEFVNTGYISTFGNQNWYCGYAVSVVFAGVVLLWLGERTKTWQRALLMIYTFAGYLWRTFRRFDLTALCRVSQQCKTPVRCSVVCFSSCGAVTVTGCTGYTCQTFFARTCNLFASAYRLSSAAFRHL